MAEDAIHKSNQRASKPNLTWPRFHWRLSSWLTIVSVLLAAIFLLFPSISEGKSIIERILLGVIIALSPLILFSLVPWLYASGIVIVGRIRYYPKLSELLKIEQRDLTEIRNVMAELVQKLFKANTFEIQKAAFTNGKLYIILRKKTNSGLDIGDSVEVIDDKDGMSMGQFVVTEIRDEVYYAEGISHVDRLWLGYVREKGEITVIPHMVAIHIPHGGQNGQ
jgi:hypothetical protein